MEPRSGSSSTEEFSLVLGGPLYRLFVRTRLVEPPLRLLTRRIIVVTALAWLPLFGLSVLDGRATGDVTVPFVHDVEAYARFLVALPLLLLAETEVHLRLPRVVAQFHERGLVAADVQPRLDAAIASARRLRTSVVPEAVMLLVALGAAPLLWKHGLALQRDTWYADASDGDISLTRAGWWMVHVSAPVFQFLLLRWYWRIGIWWRFLWQVSRLRLQLTPVHPDRAGGLGFIGDASTAFMSMLFAQGAVLSGLIASRVLFDGASALAYRGQIVALVVLMVGVVLAPLLFFSTDLVMAQRDGLRRYGALATAYGREFARKWMSGARPPDEALLGNADFQSLNDLAGAGEIVREMRMIPCDLRTGLLLVASAAAPFLPLVLTVVPLGDLLADAVMMLL